MNPELIAALSKVKQQTNSTVPNIQKPAKLLNAIDETLGEPTPVGYLVALTDMLKTQHLEESLYLLGIIVAHIDKAVTRPKAIEMLQMCQSQLESTEDAPRLRSLTAIIQYSLGALSSAQLTSESSAKYCFAAVLTLAADPRPKVRRRSQDAVIAVLSTPPPPTTSHPYLHETSQYILDTLQGAIKELKRGGSEAKAIAMLTFIRNLGATWDDSNDAQLLPILVDSLTLSSEHIEFNTLTLLSYLLSSQRQAESSSSTSASDIVEALLRLQPKTSSKAGENGERSLTAWVECVGEAVVSMSSMKDATSLFSSLMLLLTNAATPALRVSIENTLALLVRHCYTAEDVLLAVKGQKSYISKVIEESQGALKSPRFAGFPLPHIFAVLVSLFNRLKQKVDGVSAASYLLSDSILTVDILRSADAFEWKKEADTVLDAAVKVCGPEFVLSLLPLNLDKKTTMDPNNVSRAWLLPLLKSSVTNTSLGHFKRELVPLSAELFELAETAREADKTIQAKVYDTLVSQIWALLNGYCEYATDITTAFDGDFVELISNILYTQTELRPTLLNALSTLVRTTSNAARSATPPDIMLEQFGITPESSKVALAHLSSLASGLLSVIFNVYSTAGANTGAASYILACAGEWMSILPEAELVEVFTRMEGALASVEGADQYALLDIVSTLVPFSGPVKDGIFALATSERLLHSTDSVIQKKAYRILSKLISDVAPDRSRDVLTGLAARKTVAPGAKRDRYLLLTALVTHLPADQWAVLPEIIPEAALGTKEANEKAREAAYELVVAMGTKMQTLAGADEYIKMLSAGLVGENPHMVSATIACVSRVAFDFHTSLSEEILRELLDTVIVFLASKNREIVKSAIGFVKVSIVALPQSHIERVLTDLVPALLNWSHEHANHFKANVRHILERLIRKFGVARIERCTPEEDRRLITNIRKRQQRAKRRKNDKDVDTMDVDEEAQPQVAKRSAYEEVLYGSDSDASGDESGDDGEQGARARAPNATVIREGGEQVLDLLDGSMMNRISAGARAKPKGTRPALASHFERDAKSGKFRFEEEGHSKTAADTTPAEDEPQSAPNYYMEAIRGEDGHTRDAKGRVKFNKRSRAEDFDFDDEPAPTEKKVKRKKQVVHIGAEFEAKKAGGDVKKNGMTPYAYVPLNSMGGKKKKGQAQAPTLDMTGRKKARQ